MAFKLDDEVDKVELLFNKFGFKYKAGHIWLKENNVWYNANEVWSKDNDLNGVITDMMNDFYDKNNIALEKQVKNFNTIRYKVLRNKSESVFKGIVFKNGYVNEKGWTKTNKIPFTTTQIPYDYDPTVKVDPVLFKLLKAISGNETVWMEKLLMLLSTTLSNINWEVFAILQGDTSVGKGMLMTMLSKLIGRPNYAMPKANQILGKNSGNNTFALRNIDDKTLSYMDELPPIFDIKSIELVKSLANSGDISFEKKNSNTGVIENYATWIGLTNNLPFIHGSTVDDALKARVQIFKFKNKNSCLKPEEWAYLGNNKLKVIKTLLPSLVKSYIKLYSMNEIRGLKFQTQDSIDFWINNSRDDEVGMYIENKLNVLNKKTEEIYEMFKVEKPHNKITKMMFGRELDKKYIMKQKKINGINNRVWYSVKGDR